MEMEIKSREEEFSVLTSTQVPGVQTNKKETSEIHNGDIPNSLPHMFLQECEPEENEIPVAHECVKIKVETTEGQNDYLQEMGNIQSRAVLEPNKLDILKSDNKGEEHLFTDNYITIVPDTDDGDLSPHTHTPPSYILSQSEHNSVTGEYAINLGTDLSNNSGILEPGECNISFHNNSSHWKVDSGILLEEPTVHQSTEFVQWSIFDYSPVKSESLDLYSENQGLADCSSNYSDYNIFPQKMKVSKDEYFDKKSVYPNNQKRIPNILKKRKRACDNTGASVFTQSNKQPLKYRDVKTNSTIEQLETIKKKVEEDIKQQRVGRYTSGPDTFTSSPVDNRNKDISTAHNSNTDNDYHLQTSCSRLGSTTNISTNNDQCNKVICENTAEKLSQLKCPACEKIFVNKFSYSHHLREHDTCMLFSKSFYYYCPYCSYREYELDIVREHMDKSHPDRSLKKKQADEEKQRDRYLRKKNIVEEKQRKEKEKELKKQLLEEKNQKQKRDREQLVKDKLLKKKRRLIEKLKRKESKLLKKIKVIQSNGKDIPIFSQESRHRRDSNILDNKEFSNLSQISVSIGCESFRDNQLQNHVHISDESMHAVSLFGCPICDYKEANCDGISLHAKQFHPEYSYILPKIILRRKDKPVTCEMASNLDVSVYSGGDLLSYVRKFADSGHRKQNIDLCDLEVKAIDRCDDINLTKENDYPTDKSVISNLSDHSYLLSWKDDVKLKMRPVVVLPDVIEMLLS